jgi:multicomponent Na+:H+ antiporter subunit E
MNDGTEKSESTDRTAPPPLRVLAVVTIFALTWLLWSGTYKPLLFFLGAVSVVLVAVITLRAGFLSRDVYSFYLAPGLPGYWAWLFGEIVKSNLVVARVVLSPDLPIAPRVLHVRIDELSPVKQTVLANSITLTPGTLSVDIADGILEVHCLTDSVAEDLLGGAMMARVRALPGD